MSKGIRSTSLSNQVEDLCPCRNKSPYVSNKLVINRKEKPCIKHKIACMNNKLYDIRKKLTVNRKEKPCIKYKIACMNNKLYDIRKKLTVNRKKIACMNNIFAIKAKNKTIGKAKHYS